MDTKQPLSLFLVAILAASVFTVVGVSSFPLRNVSAQAATVETSADELGGTFFGHGALQVTIEDDSKDDDNNDDADVTIDVEGVSDTFTIPNTSEGSQKFEFFLIHVDSAIAGDLDGLNAVPEIITFGPGGDLDTGDDLFTDADIQISYENEDVNIQYEEDPAELSLDRETAYGSASTIHVFITDQDANINPTEVDRFELTVADLGDLFVVEGGSFDDDVIFEETGTNSAIFEGEVSLNTTSALPTFTATEETIQLTVNDQAQYNTTLTDSAAAAIAIEDGGINDSIDTDDVTFEIDDEDGTVDDIATLTFGSELVATVRDDDQNIDSDEEDDIEDGLTVEVDVAGGDSEAVDLTETDENTGVFEIDASNGELKLSFLADGVLPTANNGILEFRPGDIDEDVIVSYEDPLNDNSVPETVAEFTVTVTNTPGSLSAPEEVGVTDEFVVTLTDPDLNDNKRTRDSYSFVMDGVGPYALQRGSAEFGDLYTVEIEVDGDSIDVDGPITVTMTETGINTGIFEFELDVEEDITTPADLEVSDGDDITVNIDDCFDDEADCDEDDVSVTIGKPNVGLDFSRTTVPVPPTPGEIVESEVGGDVVIRMVLVDPSLATQSNVEEIVPFAIGEDPGEFTIEVDGDDVNNFVIGEGDTLASEEIVDGVTLDDVLSVDDLEETGKATGVFEAEITLNGDAGMDSGDWQDAEFTFTYTNDEDDEESAGFTVRGNDGVVTVDQPSAKTGTVITITVEDQDLNLDDDESETFEAQGDLLFIETEDEQIEDIAGCGTIEDETFEETGDDTGIFTAEFEVGEDIPVSCLDDDVVESASNILITYNDEVDSTGGGGDELEVNVPLASATGSIQVSPDLVGPATEITVLITDTDLDEDSASTDEYDSTDPNGDDFFVSFSSSRNEVDEGSPDIEETGPNTGVFMFTLELITDEEACQDDDLDDDEFKAEGGDTDSTIGACPGDLISIRYEDEHAGNGNSATVSEVVEVQSFDPEFVADKDEYGVGDRVTVSISDPDANRDPDIADSLTDIRVSSDSDKVGEELSALETGRDTGVFRLSFGTSEGTQSGSISVKNGDDITVTYTDEFPADFEEEEEDKDFDFVISVGAGSGGGIDSTTVTPPEPQTPAGQKLTEVSAGQQVVLTTNVFNKTPGDRSFVALIEVRNEAGVTVYLAWQTGSLGQGDTAQVGLSWTPEEAGDYTVRTFVISSLSNPSVLSPVSESHITVN